MSGFSVEFEFEIGDLVYFKSARHCEGYRPARFVVFERIAQECHGGVQRLYRLHGGGKEDASSSNFIPEVCLTRERPEYELWSSARLEERQQWLRAEVEVQDERDEKRNARWEAHIAARDKRRSDQ